MKGDPMLPIFKEAVKKELTRRPSNHTHTCPAHGLPTLFGICDECVAEMRAGEYRDED